MTTDTGKAEHLGDIVLSLLVFAGATLLFAGAAGLPEPRFEPLGSAALPRILGALLYGFGLLVGGRALLGLQRSAIAGKAPGDKAGATSPLVGFYILVVLCLYVAALDLMQAPFVVSSAVFLGLAGYGLSGWSVRAGAIYTAIGLGVAFAIAYVFTNFLYISFG